MQLTLLPDHEAYIKRVMSDSITAKMIWTAPLDSYLEADHVPLDVTAGQFMKSQRRLWCELNRRIALIPPKGNRSAGMAQVMLVCNLAQVCYIHDATALRIVNSCYEWQSIDGIARKPPVASSSSFRVIKQRMLPAA